jgi:hypothetical protein
MIVPTSVKVGIAGFLKTLWRSGDKGFFYALSSPPGKSVSMPDRLV